MIYISIPEFEDPEGSQGKSDGLSTLFSLKYKSQV